MLTVEAHGRYRYYRLAGPEVGALIEALERFAPTVPVRVTTIWPAASGSS